MFGSLQRLDVVSSPTSTNGMSDSSGISRILLWAAFLVPVLLLTVLLLLSQARAGQFLGLYLTPDSDLVEVSHFALNEPASVAVGDVRDIPDQRIRRLVESGEATLLGARDRSGPEDIANGKQRWWSRLSLVNQTNKTRWRLMLEDPAPVKFEALIFTTVPEMAGENVPKNRLYKWYDQGLHRDLRYGKTGQSLTLSLEPGLRHDIFVLVETDQTIGRGLSLQEERDFRTAERKSIAQYAISSGMVFVIVLTLALCWAVWRRLSFLLVSAYSFGILLSVSFWYGMPFVGLIFSDFFYNASLGALAGKFAVGMSAVCMLEINRRMLQMERFYPLMAKSMPWVAAILSLGTAALAVLPVSWYVALVVLLLPVLAASALWSLQATVSGVALGRWLAIGNGPMFMVVILLALAEWRLFPSQWLTPLDLLLALSFQLVLLLPALALRLGKIYSIAVEQVHEVKRNNDGITEKLQKLEAQIGVEARKYEDLLLHWEKAVTDPLTGARNIVAFELELQQIADAISGGKLTDCPVVMINLDGIKPINALRSRRDGDVYIARFSNLLIDALLGKARLYRLGGDEFALLPNTDIDIANVGDEIRYALTETLQELVRQGYVMAHASIGTALFSEGDNQPHKVQRLADEAVWIEKRKGSDNAVIKDRAVMAYSEKKSQG